MFNHDPDSLNFAIGGQLTLNMVVNDASIPGH
jgi:hypothetical protein